MTSYMADMLFGRSQVNKSTIHWVADMKK